MSLLLQSELPIFERQNKTTLDYDRHQRQYLENIGLHITQFSALDRKQQFRQKKRTKALLFALQYLIRR